MTSTASDGNPPCRILPHERFKLIPEAHLLLFRRLFRRDELLMLLRQNTGYEDGNYSVPAGHIDGGETARAAMSREAREEVGLTISPEALRLCHVMHRRTAVDERVSFFFVASEWSGEATNTEPDKCSELRWFPRDALPGNTVRYVARAIEHAQRGVPYGEFGWGPEAS